MSTSRFKTLLAIALMAASLSSTAAVDPHAGPAAASPAHRLSFDHGRKWKTDEPLRAGMAEIRAALGTLQAPTKQGPISDAEYRAVGVAIEKSVGDIVARCKLPPAADANLHVIVADLVAAADTLQGKAATKPAQGLRQARRALLDYERYFDDHRKAIGSR